MKRLRAFTLTETIFVILLTSIIVAFSLYAALIVKKHEIYFMKQRQGKSNTTWACARLSSLFARANRAFYTNKGIELYNTDLIAILKVDGDSLYMNSSKGIQLASVSGQLSHIDTINLDPNTSYIKCVGFKITELKHEYRRDFLDRKSVV